MQLMAMDGERGIRGSLCPKCESSLTFGCMESRFLLSLETSTSVCSVAVHEGGQLMAHTELHIDRAHAGKLTQLVRSTLSAANLAIKDLGAVAVSAGPGSYTGLRIGAATAKGICYAASLPLIAVGSLEAQARMVVAQTLLPENARLCPMIDARRMEVYTALYDRNGLLLESPKPYIIDETAFDEWLKDRSGTLFFFGDGAAKCEAVLSPKGYVPIGGIYATARYVGELAWPKWQAGEFANLAYFEPDYLKSFEAKLPTRNQPLVGPDQLPKP